MDTTCNQKLPEELQIKLQDIAKDLCARQMTYLELGQHETLLDDAPGRAAILHTLNEYVIQIGEGRYHVELCDYPWFGDEESHIPHYGGRGMITHLRVNSRGFGETVVACAVIDSQANIEHSTEHFLFTLSKKGMRYRRMVSHAEYDSRKIEFAINNRRRKQSDDGDVDQKEFIFQFHQKLKERIAQFDPKDDRRIDAEYHLNHVETNIFDRGSVPISVFGTQWQRISAACRAIGISMSELF